MPSTNRNTCPTLRPSREKFEQPFSQYVADVFRRHPDWACFKVIPPKGYCPRRGGYDLTKVEIGTPIRQHAFGTGGAYSAILEEHPSMTAEEFSKFATSPDRQPPRKGHREDDMLERSFWSSVTLNPPLYGADTPVSLFDERVSWGWNLRNLSDLLKQHKVPDIPGVTSPMTYFGMWRAFFCWHKEDCDLFSVNYLHLGAPKVWYAVPPSASDRFDAMTRQLYPEAAKRCQAFMRHKDIIISPKVLRSFGVPFVQARQKPGEFIVLNAAAYHAGFNMGFNCAEAVNFALEQWADVGRDCSFCECGALPQGVQLDMSIIFPGIYDSSSEEEEEEEGSSDEETGSESSSYLSECSTSESDNDSDDALRAEGERRSHVRSKRSSLRLSCPTRSSMDSPRTPQQGLERNRKRKCHGDRQSYIKKGEAKNRGQSKTSGQTENPERTVKKQRTISRPPKTLEISPLKSPDEVPKGALDSSWGKVLEPRPVALVSKDAETRQVSFEIVHRLERSLRETTGIEYVGVLERGEDGLFRPTRMRKRVELGLFYPRLTRVRVEWNEAPKGIKRRCGWWLKTKPELILM